MPRAHQHRGSRPRRVPGAGGHSQDQDLHRARGLRRCRRIRRDHERPRESAVGGRDEDSAAQAQLHERRRTPLGASADAESSTGSVEPRFVPTRASLDPGLAFSVGAGGSCSDNSDDRSGSRSSTGAGRHGDVPRPRTARPRVVVIDYSSAAVPVPVPISTEAFHSSVDSDLRGSNAVKVSSDRCDRSDDEEEARSTGRCRGNGSSSVVGATSVRLSAAEESVGKKGGCGNMHSGADPWSKSRLVLQRAQEALENEVEKIMAIGEEPSDEFDAHDDECSGSAHLEEPTEDARERIKHLESRLEEASALIREKASRMHDLEAIPGQMQPGKTTIESANLVLSQPELDQLYQEKMESEIQCIILTRAYQASATLAEDQITLYETQKSLLEDYRLLGVKLRHTESRAMVLEATAEKLQLQCKELSRSSEVLQLRYKASRVSFFCFVQFLLLCFAIGTYLMRLSSPSPTEVVPT